MDASGKCLVTGRNKPTQKNRLANRPSGPVGDVISGNATDNEESQWQSRGMNWPMTTPGNMSNHNVWLRVEQK